LALYVAGLLAGGALLPENRAGYAVLVLVMTAVLRRTGALALGTAEHHRKAPTTRGAVITLRPTLARFAR
jgi:hypothetical protein